MLSLLLFLSHPLLARALTFGMHLGIRLAGQGLLKFQMQTGAVGHGEYFFLSFGECLSATHNYGYVSRRLPKFMRTWYSIGPQRRNSL